MVCGVGAGGSESKPTITNFWYVLIHSCDCFRSTNRWREGNLVLAETFRSFVVAKRVFQIWCIQVSKEIFGLVSVCFPIKFLKRINHVIKLTSSLRFRIRYFKLLGPFGGTICVSGRACSKALVLWQVKVWGLLVDESFSLRSTLDQNYLKATISVLDLLRYRSVSDYLCCVLFVVASWSADGLTCWRNMLMWWSSRSKFINLPVDHTVRKPLLSCVCG